MMMRTDLREYDTTDSTTVSYSNSEDDTSVDVTITYATDKSEYVDMYEYYEKQLSLEDVKEGIDSCRVKHDSLKLNSAKYVNISIRENYKGFKVGFNRKGRK